MARQSSAPALAAVETPRRSPAMSPGDSEMMIRESYMNGQSMDYIAKQGRTPIAEVRRLCAPLADARAAYIARRKIKPMVEKARTPHVPRRKRAAAAAPVRKRG